MNTILRKTTMRCITGGHNKFYEVRIVYNPSHPETGGPAYVIETQYGPIGKNGVRGKDRLMQTAWSAEKCYDEIISGKRRSKGGKEPYLADPEFVHPRWKDHLAGKPFAAQKQPTPDPAPAPSKQPALNWGAAGPRLVWG